MNKQFFKLGIIGNPLSHSISPLIQSQALKSVGAEGFYRKFEISAEDIPKQIQYFKENGFTGFNVTIPHKVEILKYLDDIDVEAEKIGAVNTIKISDKGKLKGFNTDIYGFVNSIPDEYKNINNAVILGCGGASLAVIFGLEQLECKNITIAVRNVKKTEQFIDLTRKKTNMNFNIINFDDLKTINNTDILINATPLGTLGENENKSALNEKFFKECINKPFVFDLVYNPQLTLFLRYAQKYSFNYTNGLNMLILQGAKAFEIWTEASPDTNIMKSAYLQK